MLFLHGNERQGQQSLSQLSKIDEPNITTTLVIDIKDNIVVEQNDDITLNIKSVWILIIKNILHNSSNFKKPKAVVQNYYVSIC